MHKPTYVLQMPRVALNRRISNGDVRAVQEFMRHANSRTTLEVYSQARIRAKREAQQRVVEMIKPDDTEIMMQRVGPDECLGIP
jgi:hypothetical protein